MTDKRTPQAIIADAVTLISDDLDELRDEIRNANKPVIEALGRVMKKLDDMQADFRSYQHATNGEISRLRKKAAHGPTSAE